MATCEFYAGNECLWMLTPHKHRLTRIVTLHRIEGTWAISPTRFESSDHVENFRKGRPIPPETFWDYMEEVAALYPPKHISDTINQSQAMELYKPKFDAHAKNTTPQKTDAFLGVSVSEHRFGLLKPTRDFLGISPDRVGLYLKIFIEEDMIYMGITDLNDDSYLLQGGDGHFQVNNTDLANLFREKYNCDESLFRLKLGKPKEHEGRTFYRLEKI